MPLFRNFLLLLLSALVFTMCTTQKDVSDFNINWNQENGVINKALWGFNDYESVYIEKAQDSVYQNFMKEVSPGLVRVHYGYIADEFTDENTRSWNEERIVACFNAAYEAYGNAKIMVNPIAKWPKWLADKKLMLTPEQEVEIVALFKEFLMITERNNIRVDYWEILNEREELYRRKDQLPKLWSLFNRVVAELKAIKPEIKIGGPALTFPRENVLKSFLDSCQANIDFLTWHSYASPNPQTATRAILYDAVYNIDSTARGVIKEVEKRKVDNITEFFLTEFNIQWTWTPFEPRHANHLGAIYLALVVEALSSSNMNGAAMWHFKGDAYGIIDADNQVRSAGYLYAMANQHVHGKRFEINYASDSTSEHLKVIAVENERGERIIMLINRSAADDFNASISDLGLQKENLLVWKIDRANQQPLKEEMTSRDASISIPPHSVLIIKNV